MGDVTVGCCKLQSLLLALLLAPSTCRNTLLNCPHKRACSIRNTLVGNIFYCPHDKFEPTITLSVHSYFLLHEADFHASFFFILTSSRTCISCFLDYDGSSSMDFFFFTCDFQPTHPYLLNLGVLLVGWV